MKKAFDIRLQSKILNFNDKVDLHISKLHRYTTNTKYKYCHNSGLVKHSKI